MAKRMTYEGQPQVAGPLPDYFNAWDNGKEWILKCKACGSAWALPKDHKGAAELQLMEHYFSHEPEGFDGI
jgi:hypothetical protein